MGWPGLTDSGRPSAMLDADKKVERARVPNWTCWVDQVQTVDHRYEKSSLAWEAVLMVQDR